MSLEGAVNPEVGGSSGEGVEEMSESQNINGDFSGAVPSSSATGRDASATVVGVVLHRSHRERLQELCRHCQVWRRLLDLHLT